MGETAAFLARHRVSTDKHHTVRAADLLTAGNESAFHAADVGYHRARAQVGNVLFQQRQGRRGGYAQHHHVRFTPVFGVGGTSDRTRIQRLFHRFQQAVGTDHHVLFAVGKRQRQTAADQPQTDDQNGFLFHTLTLFFRIF